MNNDSGGPFFTVSPEASASTLPPISAMEGYRVAERTALAWNNDTVCSAIMGIEKRDLKDESSTLGGKSTYWMYTFGSLSSNKELMVIVNNTLSATTVEYTVNVTKMPNEMGHFEGIRPMSNLKVDSVEAAQKALAVYRKNHTSDPVSVNYILMNNRENGVGKVDFYWWIMMTSPQNTTANPTIGAIIYIDSMSIYIDPETGAILPAPVVSLPPK